MPVPEDDYEDDSEFLALYEDNPELFQETGEIRHHYFSAVPSNLFLGRALHMLHRLRDHVERIDEGVVYAVDDLAVVLRAFLYSGDGNDVLGRLWKPIKGWTPHVLLTAPPPTGSVDFAVGSIPTRWSGAEVDGARWVPLPSWRSQPFVSINFGSGTKSYTVGEFLNAYANKWGGAHLDKRVPQPLLAIDRFAAGGLDLAGFLLRSIAVEVWHLANLAFSAFHSPGAPDNLVEGWPMLRIIPPGGHETDPRDISNRGALQWMTCVSGTCNYLLYVGRSETSTNSIRAVVEGTEYIIPHPTGGASTKRVSFQSPRIRIFAPEGSLTDQEASKIFLGTAVYFPPTEAALWLPRLSRTTR